MSEGMKDCSYAKGGAVLGRSRDFMKEPDPFRTDKGSPQEYEKGKDKYSGKDKSMKPVMPRE